MGIMSLTIKEKINIIMCISGGPKMMALLLGLNDTHNYKKLSPMFILLLESSKYLSHYFSRKSFDMEIEDREKRKVPYLKARLKQKENEKSDLIEKTPIYFLVGKC